MIINVKKKSILELSRVNVVEYKHIEKISLVIILDNIRSFNNVGSIFRTSDAFLVEKIILCGITAVPPPPDIHKTALGAEESVDWCYYEDTVRAVEDMQKKGYIVYAVEQVKGSMMLNSLLLDKNSKYAIVLGHEVKGVQQQVVDMCDGCIEIPQFGTKHSLNVSVTAGLVIWDMFKQLHQHC